MLREGLESFSKRQQQQAASAREGSGVEEQQQQEEEQAEKEPEGDDAPGQTERVNRHMLMAFRNLINNSQLPDAARPYYATNTNTGGTSAAAESGSSQQQASVGGRSGAVEGLLPWALQPRDGGAPLATMTATANHNDGMNDDDDDDPDDSEWADELDF